MVQRMQEDLTPKGVSFPDWTFTPAVSYGMGWFRYEDDPELLIDPGAWGAKAILHPEEGWAAILLLENSFTVGNIMLVQIAPLIRDAILAAE
jgi:hypothetical protein